MITEAGLFAAAIVVPAMLIVLVPRRWVVKTMLAWMASPLVVFVGVLVWESITRPEVTISFENALLGLSLISAIFIVPWGIACAVGFGIGFALRLAFRRSRSGTDQDRSSSASSAPAAHAHVAPAAPAVRPPSISQGPASTAAHDSSSNTDEWRQVHIGFEGDELKIGGLSVWNHAWQTVDTPRPRLPHPAYPEQMHDFTVQEISAESTVVRFAVSELSNGVWGFYVPVHAVVDTSVFSSDGSLRYEQRRAGTAAGQARTEKSWAVLLDVATDRVLVDCADWPESRITGNADGSLFLRLEQEDGEILFRIDPIGWTFRNQGENGEDRPLFELADIVEQLRRFGTLGPPGPYHRHISPDGTIRIDSEAVEWGNSHWVYTPRVTDIASGRIVLDLWGMDWDATIAWPGNRRVSLDFRRYHFSGDLTIELDLANESYRITREPGATADLPSGPLSDAASAMEASGRRLAAWAAKHNGSRPVWDTGGKPHPFAAWRTALVILLVAVVLIGAATALSMKLAPPRDPEPVLLRAIPKPDLSSLARMRASAAALDGNTAAESPVR